MVLEVITPANTGISIHAEQEMTAMTKNQGEWCSTTVDDSESEPGSRERTEQQPLPVTSVRSRPELSESSPEVAVATFSGGIGSGITTLGDGGGPQQERHYSLGHKDIIKDLDPTPRAQHEPWRFTPSLLDSNSFAFTTFANQPGDLHTSGIGMRMGLGTPLSLPNPSADSSSSQLDCNDILAAPSHKRPEFLMEEISHLRRLSIRDDICRVDDTFSLAGQTRRAPSLPPPQYDGRPQLPTTGIPWTRPRLQELASRQSSLPDSRPGYASSNHSSSSIHSYGSQDSYTSSVRSARGIRDPDTANLFKGRGERRHSSISLEAGADDVAHGGRSPRYSLRRKPATGADNARLVEEVHQTWDEFCDLQLLAFLQVCTVADLHNFRQSPEMLGARFKLYLMRMIHLTGNADFLLYKATPSSEELERQIQWLRYKTSTVSQSRVSMRSSSSRASQKSTSTSNSFSSQVSDGTALNHVQLEAKGLKDCLIKLQKKLQYLQNEPQTAQTSEHEDDPASEMTSLRTLLDVIETAVQQLRSKKEDLGALGFSDISLLFTECTRRFTTIYSSVKDMKRQNKVAKLFRPGRSKQQVRERRQKYHHIEDAVREMIEGTTYILKAAEAQKETFLAAGRLCATTSIMESTAELDYAPVDKYEGISTKRLVTREFLKLGDPRLWKGFICDCCPKKPMKFLTAKELAAHEQLKAYESPYCKNRSKNKNEARRHENSLHLRRYTWSCAALTSSSDAFHLDSMIEVDACGYSGKEFARTGPLDQQGLREASATDWTPRIQHLEVHKFGECKSTKKFFRVSHFRQHLVHSHAATRGKWTRTLEAKCMRDERPAEPQRGEEQELSVELNC